MSDSSIWKKEIRLRKQSSAPAATPTSSEQPPEGGGELTTSNSSVWKKEIRLRKQTGAPSTPPAASGQKTSIWKRELRLRKPEAVEPAPVESLPPTSPAQVSGQELTAFSGSFGPAPIWVGQPEDAPDMRPESVVDAAPDPSPQLELSYETEPADPVEPRVESHEQGDVGILHRVEPEAVWHAQSSEPHPAVELPAEPVWQDSQASEGYSDHHDASDHQTAQPEPHSFGDEQESWHTPSSELQSAVELPAEPVWDGDGSPWGAEEEAPEWGESDPSASTAAPTIEEHVTDGDFEHRHEFESAVPEWRTAPGDDDTPFFYLAGAVASDADPTDDVVELSAQVEDADPHEWSADAGTEPAQSYSASDEWQSSPDPEPEFSADSPSEEPPADAEPFVVVEPEPVQPAWAGDEVPEQSVEVPEDGAESTRDSGSSAEPEEMVLPAATWGLEAEEPTAATHELGEVVAGATVVAAGVEALQPGHPAPDTTDEAAPEGAGKRGFGRRAKAEGAASGTSPDALKSGAMKNVVGLRIGSSQLAAARIHNNGSAELVQVARTPLARGIVSAGEVRDVEALTIALKSFFTEHKLPRKGIRLGIASNRIGVRMLEAPMVDDPKQFENSIRFHAQEVLPIAISDAIVDHVLLGETTGENSERLTKVLLVFAHRELVERHVEACRKAGLKLDGIDLEAFALLRAVAPPLDQDAEASRAVVAVAIGQERTIFAVSDGRVCDFTRVLEWGGGSIDVAIARELDITPSQAEPIKHLISLDLEATADHSEYSAETLEVARTAARDEIQVLSRELVASLHYYQTRPESLDIGEITVSGGGAQLGGFAPELQRLIGVPVRVADPFSRVVVSKKMELPEDAGSLAVAIGLGIED